MLRSAIYARLSIKGRFNFEDSLSLIYEEGGEITANFIDIGQDGYSFDRPEYQRMKKCINDGLLDLIVVPSFVEFSRDVSKALEEINFIKKKGVKIIFADIDLDMDEVDITSDSFKKVLDAVLDAFPIETIGKDKEIEDELHANKNHIEDYMDDFQVVDTDLLN